MSAPHDITHPILRRLATATCLVALLPIGMGALVTTLKAGMAFADWPSSDGQNMLLYPWFRDFADHPDKFVEHGHRLAGMLIGCVSLVLFGVAMKLGKRREQSFAIAILVAVIAQGLLGGARVLLNRNALAMSHSVSGSAFFALCVVFRLMCSAKWPRWKAIVDHRFSPVSAALVIVAAIAVVGQYVLGGMLRHLHTMLNEHVVSAVFVTVSCSAAAWVLMRSGHELLRACGIMLAVFLLTQVCLGVAAYATRFGIQSVGYVATIGTPSQVIVCSLHTVTGMLLFASAVVSLVSMSVLHRAGCMAGLRLDAGVLEAKGALP